MARPTPPLGQRIRGLAAFGLAVGLIRYALEFVAPAQAWWFGVYWLMPVAILVVGVRGSWGNIRWPALFGTMFVVALIVWGVTNTVAYTTGQFEHWNHGRFYNGGPDDTLSYYSGPSYIKTNDNGSQYFSPSYARTNNTSSYYWGPDDNGSYYWGPDDTVYRGHDDNGS